MLCNVLLIFYNFYYINKNRSSSTSPIRATAHTGDHLVKETQKIALACFIGGALGAFVTLLVSPTLWWFGILAGFAGGYVSYEFKQVRQAIPVAWKEVRHTGYWVVKETIGAVEEFFERKHPFFYPSLALAILLAPKVKALFYLNSKSQGAPLLLDAWFYVVACVLANYVIAYAMAFLAFIGSRYGEKCYFYPFFTKNEYHADWEDREEYQRIGLREEPATYRNVVRWIAKGIPLCLYGIVWRLPLLFIGACWQGVMLFCRFLVQLFKLIHSDKRLLCGTDAAIGAAVSYTWLTSLGNPFVVVIGGGLIGVALGILNWELVSKRWLGVAEA